MTNIIAVIPGSSSDIIMLAGHYDTKCLSRFIGANDGASSTAFLLEMARILAGHTHPVTYWLVFFDGEEALKTWSNSDGLYGSRHLAQKLAATDELKRIRAMILVDTIGDSNLHIHRESNSDPQLTNLVFHQAQALGYARYFIDRPVEVEDDHLPFLKTQTLDNGTIASGTPAMDLIDLPYGPLNSYWHSRFDTVDKCSPVSLGIVGRVILRVLPVLEAAPSLHTPPHQEPKPQRVPAPNAQVGAAPPASPRLGMACSVGGVAITGALRIRHFLALSHLVASLGRQFRFSVYRHQG